MLARKYDEYAWELEEQQENTVRQTAYVKKAQTAQFKTYAPPYCCGGRNFAGYLFCVRCTQRMPYFQKQ